VNIVSESCKNATDKYITSHRSIALKWEWTIDVSLNNYLIKLLKNI